MRFKIDLANLIVGSKFTGFALFYFVFEGNFPSTSPRGAYIWRGDLTEGFFALPVWGAYNWREFYGVSEEHPVGRLQETSIPETFRHFRQATLV